MRTEPILVKAKRGWFIHVRYLDNGKIKQYTVTEGMNREKDLKKRAIKAQIIIDKLKYELENGLNLATKKIEYEKSKVLIHVLQSELDAWLPNKRPRTQQGMKVDFNQFKAWLESNKLHNIDIGDFDTPKARLYMDHMVKSGKSGKTLNVKKGMLSILFNSLVNREVITKNPFRGIPKYKEESGSKNQAFTDEERKMILEEVRGTWLESFVLIEFYTYIRPNELFGLTVGNVSSDSIQIPANVSKNGKSESVVIPKNLQPVLKRMELYKYPSNYYLFAKKEHRYDLTTVGPNRIEKRNQAYKAHKKVLDKLGIKGKTLYSWKHSGVVAAYKATNGDIYAIMRQCRHYSILQTQTYLKSLGLIRNDAMSGEW